MKIIESNVELFDEGFADGVGHDSQVSHVARCARVCYASTPTLAWLQLPYTWG